MTACRINTAHAFDIHDQNGDRQRKKKHKQVLCMCLGMCFAGIRCLCAIIQIMSLSTYLNDFILHEFWICHVPSCIRPFELFSNSMPFRKEPNMKAEKNARFKKRNPLRISVIIFCWFDSDVVYDSSYVSSICYWIYVLFISGISHWCM